MAPFDPSRQRVFIAEDDRALLELIEIRLQLAGYQTAFARDGMEALRAIGLTRPSGVILDINMPKLDGFGVLKALKSTPHTADIPVMVLTARHAPQDVERAISLGAKDYLAKPFKDEMLLLRVARLLRVRPAKQTTAYFV